MRTLSDLKHLCEDVGIKIHWVHPIHERDAVQLICRSGEHIELDGKELARCKNDDRYLKQLISERFKRTPEAMARAVEDAGWIPRPIGRPSAEAFFGVDRTVDRRRLASSQIRPRALNKRPTGGCTFTPNEPPCRSR